MPPSTLLSPRAGYDAAAPSYRRWHWYHFWRTNESPLVAKWLHAVAPGSGLDAGAGTGPYASAISALGARCVAVDISLEMLKLLEVGAAGERAPARIISQVQGDLVSLPFRDAAFDWILCSRVLSHIADLDAAVRELARVLRAGGECLISDVHPDHPYQHVRIPGPDTPVEIQTHKHPLERLTALLDGNALGIESLTSYRLGDLAEPPSRLAFAKLYRHPDRPIFYVARVVRRRL
jgi:ubiquinone/menaquinone biosynthesis C-methylase UbiE